MERIEFTALLPQVLHCQADVLGQELPIVVEGHPGVFAFPCAESNGILGPPSNAIALRVETNWGVKRSPDVVDIHNVQLWFPFEEEYLASLGDEQLNINNPQ